MTIIGSFFSYDFNEGSESMGNARRMAFGAARAMVVLAVVGAGLPVAAGSALAGDATVNCVPSPPAANVGVAQAVFNEGRERNVSGTVMTAAFEVAQVESRFNNCSNGHGTSAGVFQQVSGGSWGTYDQRTTIAYAAQSFFVRAQEAERRLGPSASAAQIAQDVQRSDYPSRYADAKAEAERMLARVRPVIEAVSNGAGTRIVAANAYVDVSSTGQVYAWNTRYHGGSPSGYSGRFVDARATRDNAGYWLLTSRGQVYAYGNAPYRGGSPTGFAGEIVAMAAHPDGQGYVLVSATGQVYAYGSAPFAGGSPTGYSGTVVDVEMTSTGRGYWLLTSAGQVYAYGDARYHGGSPTGFDRAVVALSRTPDGGGYVMVSKTGQVYAYGNAAYRGGSPRGIGGEIADISYSAGSGYVLVSTSGGHYAYGDAPFVGNPAEFSGTF